jgi:Zn-dependent oligopeptidase
VDASAKVIGFLDANPKVIGFFYFDVFLRANKKNGPRVKIMIDQNKDCEKV